MTTVWEEILASISHAFDRLFVDGYMTAVYKSAIYDDTGVETVDHLVGCKCAAKNDAGDIAYEDVWYPDDWQERLQHERLRQERTRRDGATCAR